MEFRPDNPCDRIGPVLGPLGALGAARYRLRPPRVRFACTVQLARTQLGIRPTKLPDVCCQLRIPLRHHDAGSETLACACIVLMAEAEGWRPRRRTMSPFRAVSRGRVSMGSRPGLLPAH